MSTLSEAYRYWIKKYPSWKMERPVRIGTDAVAFVLLDSDTQKRKILYHARVEFVTTIAPINQSVTVHQIIVDGLALKQHVPLIVACRGRFYEVDAAQIIEHRSTKREQIRGEAGYRFTLSDVRARDISKTMAKTEQAQLFEQGAI